jgi:hypothetical protein
MRHRFVLLALVAAFVLAAGACGGDPAPEPGASAPAAPTTTAGPEPTTAPPTTVARAERPAPKGVIPADEREAAPDIEVTTFDGRTVTLGGFRGQPVVVNFFESW